jgi:hypothetical protein
MPGRRRFREATLGRGRRGLVHVNLVVSERDFNDFRGQRADCQRFLGRHRQLIIEIVGGHGVKDAALDFGVADLIQGGRGPVAAMFFEFPSELVERAAAVGVGLGLSVYPVSVGRRRRVRR